jgi:hypothetical protein
MSLLTKEEILQLTQLRECEQVVPGPQRSRRLVELGYVDERILGTVQDLLLTITDAGRAALAEIDR